jgi:hypothetical protein
MMPWMDYTPRTACEIMQNGGVKWKSSILECQNKIVISL